MDLLLATRNAHKTREFAEILGDGFQVSDHSSPRNIPGIKETGQTFAENAILKALAVSHDRQSQDLQDFVVADDSGLEVDGLEGRPGIYSARYAGETASDQENVERLLRELARQPEAKRTARFRCVIALARGGELLGTFEGIAEGTIVDPPRGRDGFGYDPVFLPAGFDQTFAELPAKTKNEISHRVRAAGKLVAYLNTARPSA